MANFTFTAEILIPFLKDYIALTDRLKDPTRLHRLTAYATKDPVY